MASPRAAVLLLLFVTVGCTSPLLDQDEKVRRSALLAPSWSPVVSWSRSDDGTSWSWSTLFWLVGADQEGDRGTRRALPFWWTGFDGQDNRTTLLAPLYYGHTSEDVTWRFYTPLWGYRDSPESRHDYVAFNLFDVGYSKTSERKRSGLFGVYGYENRGSGRTDVSIMPIWGLAHLAKWELGFPAEGVTVPALGRSASRRVELLNVFGLITLYGYDDVGDRREHRLLTIFSNEAWSPLRSWRGRGEDPFVSEWVFPLYMNKQSEDGGWLYVGPFWGRTNDREDERVTDWWLAGLVTRSRRLEGDTWRVLGIPVSSPVTTDAESTDEPADD